MKIEEQILAGVEELAVQLKEIKKQVSIIPNGNELNQSGIDTNRIEELLQENAKLIGTYSKKINDLSSSINDLAAKESSYQKETIHTYIEIKHWKKWVVGFIIYLLLSLGTIGLLVKQSQNTKVHLKSTIENDIKYRFLKVQGEPLSNLKAVAANTTELTYYIDSYYHSKPLEMEKYVTQREEQIRQAFEAAELAKQKEAEAKSAREKAQQLKDKLQ